MWRKKLECTTCGGDGPFRKDAKGRFGLSSRCKKCLKLIAAARLATPEGRAARMWSLINQRCGKVPAYLGVEVRLTRGEFLAWAVPAVRRWQVANPNGTPSIDRKSGGHYEIGNLRVVSVGENSRTRAYNKTVNAPPGKAWCGGCKQYLGRAKFSPRPGRSTGVQGRCKKCFREYMREWRSKQCP